VSGERPRTPVRVQSLWPMIHGQNSPRGKVDHTKGKRTSPGGNGHKQERTVMVEDSALDALKSSTSKRTT